LVPLVITLLGTTASADPPGPPNIPEWGQKSDADATLARPNGPEELPLPYDAWQGTRYSPPRAAPPADLPAPFARPRELPRRPFEVSATLAAFLPSCAAGSIDNRGCVTIDPGAGFDAALLYRSSPFFSFGVEGVLSGFGGQGHGAFSAAGGRARFLGVTGRLYFAESGAWDPYASLTLGYGALTLRAPVDELEGGSDGLGGRVAGGIDYLLGSTLRVGPSAGFAHFIAWREQHCSGRICRHQPLAYGRLLGFATLGIRLTASFGETL
jgi:hypothetical protein